VSEIILQRVEEISCCERKRGECCVYVCTAENFIVLVHRVTWPEEVRLFWEAYADFHFLLFVM
jgi:hypothetical protein